MTRRKFTVERERQLLDPDARPADRANAITCMRSDEIVRHEELIVSFLDHVSPHLRSAALDILVTWGRYEYVPLALQRLASDEDEIVRGQMTMTLATAAHFGRDFDLIARALVSAVERDPDRDVARRAYKAARVILVPEDWFATRIDEEAFDRTKDVDWTLLAPYRTPPNKTSTAS
jgi:hypothetical protein